MLNVDSDKVIALNQPVTIVAGESPDTCQMELRLFGVLPLKSIDIEVIENTRLIPVGQPIGIYMKTQGVLVMIRELLKDRKGRNSLHPYTNYRLEIM